jgi:hypothetical protein
MPDGSLTYYYALGEKRKLSSSVTGRGICHSLEELEKAVHHAQELALCITGKGIIEKPAEGIIQSVSETLQQLMPSAKPDELSVQAFTSGSRSWLAISRRNSTDEILQAFRNVHLIVNRVFLGSGILDSSDSSDVQGNDYALCQSALGALVTTEVSFSDITGDGMLSHRRDAKFKTWFLRLFVWGPFALLALVSANYIVHSRLSEKVSEKQSIVNQYRLASDSLLVLRQKQEERKKLLGNSGELHSIPASQYADQLASTLPSSVTLTELNIFPLNIEENETSRITIASDTLSIRGLTAESTSLYQWMALIKNLSWVDKLTLIDFHQKNTSEPGAFQLEVLCR